MKRYDQEFKRDAVSLLINSGKPLKEPGISDASLRDWREDYLEALKGVMKKPCFSTIGFVIWALIFTLTATAQTTLGPLRPEGVAIAEVPPPAMVVVGRSGMPPFRIAAPAHLAAQPQTTTFTIQYLNAGEVNFFGDTSIGWPADAQTAFSYAADVWSTLINSSVPIKVSAGWANLGTGGLLGYAGARDFYKDFAGAPQAGAYYPAATANALYGRDLNGSGTEEITAGFNAQFTDWYFGTDGACPADKIDFVQVVMHEFCHGLGFIGSMSVSGRIGTWGIAPGYPAIYDRFTENEAGQKLIAFSSDSSALASQLTRGNVYFNGANANAGNSGSRVKLYAPSSWAEGSSYVHLDEIFNGTVNAMMTYAIDYGEAIHNPGPVALGILKDTGWTGETPPPFGLLIEANRQLDHVTINSSDALSITVQLHPGNYAGVPVDWWVVARAGSSWFYLNNSFQWTQFDGNLSNCHPVHQGALDNLPATEVWNITGLPTGSYMFYFAVDLPMDGILNIDGPILVDGVNVSVQ